MLPAQIIKGCWIIYILYWVVSAWKVKATAERQSLAGILSSRIPFVPGVILLLGPRLPHPLDLVVLGPADVTAPIGAALCVAGLFGAIWSRKTLADNWSALVTFKQGHELIKSGPYRFVRHPIYTSILMLLLGTAIAAGRLASLLAMVFFFAGFWIKLKQEEALLIGHFPDEYPAYQTRVKTLVPFVF
jgi:protein-S-isoprenylcysteine O-methyltransferase Ste14